MKIRVLPDSVANQIAAGEVVGSPSSVVKELTENAIDAGASQVTVNFRADGRELVQVIDNGCGMSPADARLAFDKHATSKIASLEDIYALQTFGFRGEALPSIAAVAEVELTTRTSSDELASRIVIEGGEFRSQDMVVAPVGSNFKVANLFYNVPARRKFLESSEREAGKIKTEFRRVALCHPEVGFQLYRDDAPLYNLPATNRKGRIAAVMGKHIASSLLELSTTTSIVTVEGFVGRPEMAKKRKEEQYFFVNGRFFKSPYLHKAVMAAYEKLLPAGLTPSYFIYLTVDTHKVDVNVHPQKTEVKFSEDSEIWQIVNAAVREALAKTGVVPMMDFEDEGEVTIPVFDGSRGPMSVPSSTSNPFYNPFAGDCEEREFESGIGGEGLPAGLSRTPVAPAATPYPSRPSRRVSDNWGELGEADGWGTKVEEKELFGWGEEEPEWRPTFKGVLPLAEGYAATSLGGELVVVNLKRAYELMLYGRYRMMIESGNSVSQTLMFPERMIFSSDDAEFIRDNHDYFTTFGFDLRVSEENVVEMVALPADLENPSMAEEIIYDMIDSLRQGVELAEAECKERLARLLSRVGELRNLSVEEIEALLASLDGCEGGTFTPDGRLVAKIIDCGELARLFK